jgi:hypothetical protein
VDFSRYQRESRRKPVTLNLPDGVAVTIPVPDGGKVMEVEEAGLTRRTLRVLLGDDYSKVEPFVKGLPDGDALREFVTDLVTELGLRPDDAPPADGPR